MYLITFHAAVFFLLMIMNPLVAAAGSNCSYSASVKQSGMTFAISSRPANGCAVQIITVIVHRGGKKISGVKADVDYLAQSARSIDLTGDGMQELAVFSRTIGEIVTEVLDVYWLDGTTLRRSTVPDLDEKSGYKGGDRFLLEGRLIVRSFPVYGDGDTAGKPTGGTRSLKYEFKKGEFTPSAQTEKGADSTMQSAPLSASAPSVEVKPAVSAVAGAAITGITVSEAGIEIRVNRAEVKYKTIRLNKPERIAIDIPGADSSLVGKKISINRFGISTARVGRNKGFLRVVLDSTLSTFPKYLVNSSDTGVLVAFPQ